MLQASSVPPTEKEHPGRHQYLLRLFAALFAVSLLSGTVGLGLSWRLTNSLAELVAKQSQLTEYTSQVMLYDEVLTMSARMAAATGDLTYQQRYDRFEASLAALIKETGRSLHGTDVGRFVEQTDEANRKLVEIERRALTLASEGRLTEATALLVTDEYLRWKGVYADGVEKAVAEQRSAIDGKQRQVILLQKAVVGSRDVILLLLLSVLYVGLRAARRWNKERLRSAAALREAHDELQIRVRERTAELSIANETLRDNTATLEHEVVNRSQSEAKLRFANTLLQTTIETSPDGIIAVDKNARIITFNRRFCAMWGVPIDVLEAGDEAPVLAAVTASMKDPEAFRAGVDDLRAHREETKQEVLETNDGRIIERDTASLHLDTGQHLGRVLFHRDITARREAEADVRRMASHDALTGLDNRLVFMEAVERAIARAQRGDNGFAVLFVDLDDFKDVNDTLGHPVGDVLLREVAERLRHNVRDTDLVARFGGDEFAVMAAAIDEPADAANLADKLIRALGNPCSIEGNDIRSSVSIGIAVYDTGDADPETLVSHADLALYRAKVNGGAGYRFFTDAMDAEVRARVRLTAELRQAIASEQFFLQYQPQIEIETGRICGVEALVRWRHPERGVLAPGEFISAAEKTGLIMALDRWVMREACRQGKAWLDAGIPPVVIAVNVSGGRFRRASELEQEIAAVLANTGLPPQQLELELTETVLMEASGECNEILVRLRQGGIKLAIDDFGTGYSSLDYLRRYPADRVKIAQDFVRQIEFDPGSAAIVKATIGLTGELGMMTIAEGVENAKQLKLLTAWGCRDAQGFYFSKPLAAEDLVPLLRRGRIRVSPAIAAKTAA